MAIEIRVEKARLYLVGNTYPVKERIRALGGHWDSDRKAWWVGAAKREEAEALVKGLANEPSTPAPQADSLGTSQPVRGQATYKGRTYYVVWEGTTSRGPAFKLAFRDGSKIFWADAAEVSVIKRYGREGRGCRIEYPTIASLAAYAERKRKEVETGECSCRCHREPDAGKPGSILYDGCDRCGCEAC